MQVSWNTPICRSRLEATMVKYGGYLLAVIFIVWIVIGMVALSTWLKERKYFS